MTTRLYSGAITALISLSFLTFPSILNRGSEALEVEIDLFSGYHNDTVLIGSGIPRVELRTVKSAQWNSIWGPESPPFDQRCDMKRIDGTDCHLYYVSYYYPPNRIYRYYLYNETSNYWSVLEDGILNDTFLDLSMAPIMGTKRMLIAVTLAQGRGMVFRIYDHNSRSITDEEIHAPWTLRNRTDAVISSVGSDGHVLLWGGRSGLYPNVTYLNDTYLFDPANNSWSEIPATGSPSPRYYQAVSSIMNTDKVLMFGGLNGTMFHETHLFDLSDMGWENISVGVHPAACTHAGMAPLTGTDRVLLYGGYDGREDISQSFEFRAITGKWSEVQAEYPPGAVSRHFLSPSIRPGSLILFSKRLDNFDLRRYITHTYVSEGVYTTEPMFIDADRLNHIEWSCDLPEGTIIDLSTRSSGYVEDLGMKNFSSPVSCLGNDTIGIDRRIENGSIIQLRFHLRTYVDVISPYISSITVVTNHAPHVIISSPENGSALNSSEVRFEWTYSDRDDDPQQRVEIELSRSSHPFVPHIHLDRTMTGTSLVHSFSDPENDRGGWFFRMRAFDSRGEQGPFTGAHYFFLDWDPPSVEITHPEDASYHIDIKRIAGRATDPDPESGLDSVWVSLKNEDGSFFDGSSWIKDRFWIEADGRHRWEITIDTTLEDGSYSIECFCEDVAGNTGKIETSWFIIDRTPPKALSIELFKETQKDNATILRLELSCVDELSGIDSMSFSLDGLGWDPWIPYTNVYFLEIEGNVTVFFRARDRAMNVADAVNASYNQERAALSDPDPPEMDPPPQQWMLYLGVALFAAIIVIALIPFYMRRGEVKDHKKGEE
ncbi:MAG: kelch repeat-containing protein [Candidatus Thermoplasmatota archaeon]|nr:kelch repeat-containing protein [Candidatus Thermoplasmatota archaeon]